MQAICHNRAARARAQVGLKLGLGTQLLPCKYRPGAPVSVIGVSRIVPALYEKI